jgi:hypothetical protein
MELVSAKGGKANTRFVGKLVDILCVKIGTNCVNQNQDLKLAWTKEWHGCAHTKLPHVTKVRVKLNGVDCCGVTQDYHFIC